MRKSLYKMRELAAKLKALANDRAATEGEKTVANLKLSALNLEINLEEQEQKKDRAFMRDHGFEPVPSSDPRQPNAGWQSRNRHESDDGPLRKRDYKSPPRYQNGVSRGAWMELQAQARARVQYDQEHLLRIFGKTVGDVTSPDANKARLGIKTFLGDVYTINHISLVNGRLCKRLLFWSTNKLNRSWFIIERDTVTGKTLRSKRYWSRDAAFEAHQTEQITWQRVEYT